ncbi:MAG: hypothetical protein Q4B67_10005 [Eubacteriales bacterium]|nr:hypothetical protein [Eubacteriales bacterium]
MKKRIISIITAVLMLTQLFSVSAFASTSYTSGVRVTSIPSVKINIDTTQLVAGDDNMVDPFQFITIYENSYYELSGADWYDRVNYLKIGDTPKVKVYLQAYPKETDYTNYTKMWLFQGGYNSTNVTVNRGTYISSQIRDSGYTLELIIQTNPIKGQYNVPATAYWDATVGSARWEKSENDSGIYDLALYRNGNIIKSLKNYTGNNYNFYPYMTKEGDYSFRVRCAVPANLVENGASPSEYAYSGSCYITKDKVSDGSGQTTSDENGGNAGHNAGNVNYPNGTGNEVTTGWVTDSTGTYFRYPSGEYARAGWLNLNGTWYFLGQGGKMLTGWQQDPKTNIWYYMDTNTGKMLTGWLSYNGNWYYLNKTKDSTEGCMIQGWFGENGKKFYFNKSGIMVTGWFQIDGKWYYFYPQGSRSDGKYGFLATNTMIGDFKVGDDGAWITN